MPPLARHIPSHPPPATHGPPDRRRHTHGGRWWAGAALVGLAIGAVTLRPAPRSVVPAAPSSCVVCGPLGGADAVANVLLFVPLGLTVGAALRARGTRPAWAAALGAAASLAVELAQAAGIPGRQATLGDLLTNTAGAALGAAVAAHGVMLARPSRALAGRATAAAVLAWLAASTLGAWLMQRDVAPGRWPPRLGTLPAVPGAGWYRGHVEQVTVGDWTARQRGTGPAIVGARVPRAVHVALRLAGGDDRPTFVPYLYLHDARAHGQLVVGQAGDDGVAVVRLRAANWRLRAPRLVVPGAAAALRSSDPDARARAEAAYSDGVLRLAVTSADGTRTRAVRLSAGEAWALVLPFARVSGPEGTALTAAWLAAWTFPVAYWGWCLAARSRGGSVRRVLPLALALAAGGGTALAAAPAAAGLPIARWWEWAAVLAGAAAGVLTAAGLNPWARPATFRG